MTHALTSSWSFYYIISDESDPDVNGLHKVGRFESVEQFWTLYQHMKKPSEMGDIEIGLFCKQYKLDQNDPIYKDGCLIYFKVPSELLNYQWERLIINAIGNNLDENVIGMSMRYDKEVIWIWCKNKLLADFAEDNIVNLLGIDDDVVVSRSYF